MTSGKVYLLVVTSMMTCTSVVTQSYGDLDAVYSFVKTISPTLRPVKNQSEILKVFVSFSLNAITKVDEVRQELSCNAWMNLSWTDQIRTWNKSDYGDLDLLHTDPTDIWRPRVMVSNSLQDRDIFKDDFSHVSLYWDGRVSWYPGGVIHTSCKMDMTIFPFDTHTCTIRFYSNGYYASELIFVSTRGKVKRYTYTENGEWSLSQTKVESIVSLFSKMEAFTGFLVTFTLTRRPVFFLLNVVLPIMLMALLQFMMFALPSNSGEKISFGTTLLLSQAVYMSVVSDLLPQNSDSIPLMLVYLSSVLLLCSLALGLSILIVHIHDDNNDNNDNNNDNSPSRHEKGGISQPATDVPDLFPWERKADDNGKEEVIPVKQKSDRNTKRNLCSRFVRIKGYIFSIICMGLWFLLSLAFLLCGIYH